MGSNYLTLLILLFSPLFLMIWHIIFVKINKYWLRNRLSNQQVTIFCELLLNLPLIFVFWEINKDFWGLIYCFIIYNSFGYAYFHLFNMTETARRIKILSEIREKKYITKESLTEDYKTNFMIKTRLNRLLELNQIELCGEKYFACGKLLIFASLSIVYLKKLLKL